MFIWCLYIQFCLPFKFFVGGVFPPLFLEYSLVIFFEYDSIILEISRSVDNSFLTLDLTWNLCLWLMYSKSNQILKITRSESGHILCRMSTTHKVKIDFPRRARLKSLYRSIFTLPFMSHSQNHQDHFHEKGSINTNPQFKSNWVNLIKHIGENVSIQNSSH